MGPPQGSHVLHRLRGKHEKSSSRPVPSLFNYFLYFCLFPAWVLMTGFGIWLLHCLVFAYFLLSMILLLQMDPGSRKSYKCEHCQKSFSSKYRLSFHVRNYHSFALLYHQYSITNHSESILKSEIMSILMIIFVVVFFLSDLLRNILKCNCSPHSTLMAMYLPGAILCSNVL